MHNKLKIEDALNILQQPVLDKINFLVEGFCLDLSCLEVKVLLYMGMLFFFLGILSGSLFNPPSGYLGVKCMKKMQILLLVVY